MCVGAAARETPYAVLDTPLLLRTQTMTLLEDLMSATSQGGVFHGFPLRRLLRLFASLSRHDSMRRYSDGRTCSRAQRRIFEVPFVQHHGLSYTQYECLVGMYERSDLEGIGEGLEGSLPYPEEPVGTETRLADRYFSSEVGPTCCNLTMRVTELEAVAHTIGKSYAAKHVTKRCRGHCGSVYYLNKKTYHEDMGPTEVTTHTFFPWTGGAEPSWVATKSGKVILSTSLLTSFALAQCTMR